MRDAKTSCIERGLTGGAASGNIVVAGAGVCLGGVVLDVCVTQVVWRPQVRASEVLESCVDISERGAAGNRR